MLFVAVVGNLGEVKLVFDQWSTHSDVTFDSTIPGLAGLVRILAGAWAWLGGEQALSFPNDWWFWNASRVIPDTINEFPFFTFTYADLHAHMIAIPLTLLGLATAVALVRLRPVPVPGSAAEQTDVEPSPWFVSLPELLPILLLGLVIGGLRATNTWDFPTYILVGLSALAVLEGSRRQGLAFPETLDARLAFLFRAAVSILWRLMIMVGVASITFYAYAKSYATAYAGLEPWDGPTSSPADYLIVHGFFLALIAIYLQSEWWAQMRDESMPEWLGPVFPYGIAAVMVLFVVSWVLHAYVWFLAIPLVVLALVLLAGQGLPPARRLALLLILLGLAITMGVEVVRLKDDIGRMNTVFKFYVQAWVLFGVAAAFGLAGWIDRARAWGSLSRRLAWTVSVVLFLGVALYPPMAARAKIRDRFSSEDQPHGLDGMAYMDKAEYFDNSLDMRTDQDKAAILWMLENVQGSPVILEGIAPSYRWGNRFSIYTGLPAVIGWDWHQKQQRSVIPQAVIDRRLAHVQEMYDSTDQERVRNLLDLYHVSYVVVGELERAYYAPDGLAKFDQMVGGGSLRIAYGQGTVRIYEVLRDETLAAEGDAPPVESPAGVSPAESLADVSPVETLLSPVQVPGAQVFASPQ